MIGGWRHILPLGLLEVKQVAESWGHATRQRREVGEGDCNVMNKRIQR